MTKPEIVAYYCPNNPDVADAFRWKNVRCDSRSCDCTRDALIRLTDHERLQAEAERLQAARAADKARIMVLEAALSGLLSSLTDEDGLLEHVEPVINARAALAQQGKEGEC